jgi:hypothetical protein
MFPLIYKKKNLSNAAQLSDVFLFFYQLQSSLVLYKHLMYSKEYLLIWKVNHKKLNFSSTLTWIFTFREKLHSETWMAWQRCSFFMQVWPVRQNEILTIIFYSKKRSSTTQTVYVDLSRSKWNLITNVHPFGQRSLVSCFLCKKRQTVAVFSM